MGRPVQLSNTQATLCHTWCLGASSPMCAMAARLGGHAWFRHSSSQQTHSTRNKPSRRPCFDFGVAAFPPTVAAHASSGSDPTMPGRFQRPAQLHPPSTYNSEANAVCQSNNSGRAPEMCSGRKRRQAPVAAPSFMVPPKRVKHEQPEPTAGGRGSTASGSSMNMSTLRQRSPHLPPPALPSGVSTPLSPLAAALAPSPSPLGFTSTLDVNMDDSIASFLDDPTPSSLAMDGQVPSALGAGAYSAPSTTSWSQDAGLPVAVPSAYTESSMLSSFASGFGSNSQAWHSGQPACAMVVDVDMGADSMVISSPAPPRSAYSTTTGHASAATATVQKAKQRVCRVIVSREGVLAPCGVPCGNRIECEKCWQATRRILIRKKAARENNRPQRPRGSPRTDLSRACSLYEWERSGKGGIGDPPADLDRQCWCRCPTTQLFFKTDGHRCLYAELHEERSRVRKPVQSIEKAPARIVVAVNLVKDGEPASTVCKGRKKNLVQRTMHVKDRLVRFEDLVHGELTLEWLRACHTECHFVLWDHMSRVHKELKLGKCAAGFELPPSLPFPLTPKECTAKKGSHNKKVHPVATLTITSPHALPWLRVIKFDICFTSPRA